MSKRTLHVDIEQDESGAWVGVVREDPSILTQGRSIALVKERIREAMQAAEIDPSVVVILEEVKLPSATKKALETAKAARDRANAEAHRAVAATAKAVRALTGSGVSIRDAADMLDVSSARVHQILHGR